LNQGAVCFAANVNTGKKWIAKVVLRSQNLFGAILVPLKRVARNKNKNTAGFALIFHASY
jgi:hypothetical protein